MRVVFDTNIFVSALALPGGRADLALSRVTGGQDHLLDSKAIISELVDVLGRKLARNPEELARAAVFVADLGEMIEPSPRVTALSDERDNRVLDCALAGGADLVVTGDREMLSLGQVAQTRIVSLREYLASHPG